MPSGWRRYFFFVTAGLTAFVVAYVLYVHVLSATRMASGSPRDLREGFGGSDTLPPGYGVRRQGALAFASRAGVLRVEGAGHAKDEIVFTSAPRRLDDSLVTLRFRAPSAEPLEVFVGLEAENGRAVSAAYVVGPTPFVHIGGDISGPFRSGTANEDVTVDAGAPGASEEWHTLSFQFSPRYSSAAALVDGRPVTSTAVLWPQAVDSRISFGVRLRGEVAHANVEIDSIAMQTLDEIALSFDDTFNGEILDSQRWIIQYPDSNLATFGMRLQKGKGLVLEGTAVGIVAEHAPFYFVRTPPFALRTLRATADVTVEDVKDARVFFGMIGSSAWTSMDKVFDVGLSERDGKTPIVDVTGAWMNTGAISFDLGAEVPLPHRFLLQLDYDAKTAMGVGSIDGKGTGEHRLDLKPLDLVSLRIGSGGHVLGAKSHVTVHRISLEMR
jgi:hypothetical protein